MKERVLPQESEVCKNGFVIGREVGCQALDLEFSQTDPGGVRLWVCGLQSRTVIVFEARDAPDLHKAEYGAHEVGSLGVCGDESLFLQGADGEFANPWEELFEFLGICT